MPFVNNLIYFDNNATTRLDENVFNAMLPYLREHYGNAASKLHAFGWVAQAAVEKATKQVADFLNCETEEIIFTSGATEAVNLALKGIFEAYKSKGKHIITCLTEHKAVLDSCLYLSNQGAEITYLGVDREGLIDLEVLKAAVRPETILVSVMAANNETGVIQPLEDIAQICNDRQIFFFSDATQYAGRLHLDTKEPGPHCIAFSAHKMHGPKGVGALYVSRKDPRVNLVEQMNGGGHQNERRSGTLNVAGIVGFGAAAEITALEHWENSSHISKLKNYFEHQLLEIPDLRINGTTRNRLYNTSNITFPKSKKISSLLSKFAFSSGAACSSASAAPSHVLTAMGVSQDDIKNSYRFSFGKFNSLEEIKLVVEEIHRL